MKLSVIIPVYKEQEQINDTIADIMFKADCEIVVSDAVGDTINSIKYENVIKINSPKGRAFQMNAGAEKAGGDVLLFLHADTILPDGFYAEIENALKDHSHGAFKLEINDPSPIFRMIEWGANLRNRITKCPYGDQALFCTREAFEAVGGYAEIPLMEDVRLMQDMKKKGYEVYLSELSVKTSPRRWKSEGFLYTMLRNWVLINLYYLGVSPQTLKKYYK
ncbi:MAG: TIGR04283 family arsenosugar biosynthesis glycosyltransferase [Deferribacterales bacterium]